MQKSLFFLCFVQLLYCGISVAQNLSVERYAPEVARIGNQVVFGNGQQYGGKFTARMDVYDNSTDTWSTHDMIGLEYYAPSVVAGNKLIYYPKQKAGDKLEIYDAATDAWSTQLIPALVQLNLELVADDKVVFTGNTSNQPTISIYIFNTSTGSWSVKPLTQISPYIGRILNKIIVAGGFGAFSWNPVSNVDIYDLDQNSWSTATLSEGRSQTNPAIIGNKVIFAGGRTYIGNDQDGTNQVDIYDASANTWSLDTMPGTIGYCQTAVTGTKALFIVSASPKNIVYLYDAVGATWSVHELSNNIYEFKVSAVGNKVLIAGGYSWDSTIEAYVYFNTVYIYDGVADNWQTGELSVKRIPDKVIVKAGKVIYLGGDIEYNLLPYKDLQKITPAIDVYDSSLNQWTSYSSENANFNYAVTDTKLYLAGGRTLLPGEFSRPSEKVDIFDFSNGQWSTRPLQIPRIGLSMAAFPDKVLVAGGRTEAAPGFFHKSTASVEVFHD